MSSLPPPPPPPPPGYVPFEPGRPGLPGPPRTDGQATAALVLGILGVTVGVLCFVGIPLAVLAIVFGALSRSRIARSGGQLLGRGLATAGLVLGIIGVVLYALFVVWFALPGGW